MVSKKQQSLPANARGLGSAVKLNEKDIKLDLSFNYCIQVYPLSFDNTQYVKIAEGGFALKDNINFATYFTEFDKAKQYAFKVSEWRREFVKCRYFILQWSFEKQEVSGEVEVYPL